MNQTQWTYYRTGDTYLPWPRRSLFRRINWPVLLGYGLTLVVGVGFWLGVYLKFFKG